MSNKGSKKKDDEDDSKGILKNSSDEKKGKSESPPKKSITWDEMNVTATLHPVGKDYGHMKIIEAPTPYERSRPEDGKGVDAAELARRLEQSVQEDSLGSGTSGGYSNDADDEDSDYEEMRRKRFKELRKEHYKEFSIAKMKASTLFDSDDEDAGSGASKQKKKK